MADKMKHYLEGIGSVLAVFAASRRLTVRNPAPTTHEAAFLRDTASLATDFRKAFSTMTSRVQKTQAR